MITRLDDSTRLLQMHAWVCTTVRSKVNQVWWSVHLRTALLFAGTGAFAASLYIGRDHLVSRIGARGGMAWSWSLGGGGILSGLYYALSLPLIARKRNATSEEELTELFQVMTCQKNYQLLRAPPHPALLTKYWIHPPTRLISTARALSLKRSRARRLTMLRCSARPRCCKQRYKALYLWVPGPGQRVSHRILRTHGSKSPQPIGRGSVHQQPPNNLLDRRQTTGWRLSMATSRFSPSGTGSCLACSSPCAR